MFRDGFTSSMLKDQFNIFELKCAPGVSSFPSSKNKLMAGLIASVKKRFSSVEDGVFKAAAIADIKEWPNQEASTGKISI